MENRPLRFGIVGGGLMGRELAGAMARWCHINPFGVTPKLSAVCSRSASSLEWFRAPFPDAVLTQNLDELLSLDSVDVVYIAVPHDLHEDFYIRTLQAGKHLFGEKPFGIDRKACDAILRAAADTDRLVRCSSEFPFYPAVQALGKGLTDGTFGRVIEVNAGFLHSSDMNPDKAINWKRRIDTCGSYGVMGDLGMHVCHVPFRAGWAPKNVRAILSNIMPERPDGSGGRAACETWDNATLLCESADGEGNEFPMTLKTQRISPGQKNTWYIEVLGTGGGARFSTANPRRLDWMEYRGGEQRWERIDMGYESAYSAITGPIFEFGFCDAMQQMLAAFCYEWHHGAPVAPFAGCVTPEEVQLSHRLFTAAEESHAKKAVVPIS